jgi:hypothetical protein
MDPELLGDLLHTLIYGLAVKVTLDGEVISPERAFQIALLALRLGRVKDGSQTSPP